MLVHEVGWGADDVLYELWEGGVVRHGGVVHPPPRHLQGVFHVVPDIVPEKVGKSSKNGSKKRKKKTFFYFPE